MVSTFREADGEKLSSSVDVSVFKMCRWERVVYKGPEKGLL
jgi:hypothetical protein